MEQIVQVLTGSSMLVSKTASKEICNAHGFIQSFICKT
jgi:hypothetical protein